MRQKARNILARLDVLEAELSEIEQLVDAAIRDKNPEHIRH